MRLISKGMYALGNEIVSDFLGTILIISHYQYVKVCHYICNFISDTSDDYSLPNQKFCESVFSFVSFLLHQHVLESFSYIYKTLLFYKFLHPTQGSF